MPVRQRILMAFCLATCLSACTEPDSDEQKATVVAEVNGEKITEQQLQYEAARLKKSGDIPAEMGVNDVLDRIVVQLLMKQEAVNRHLDSEDNVQQEIISLERRALAKAYFESINKFVPSEAEVSDFYIKNPDLFSKRQVYIMHELTLSQPEFIAEVKKLYAQTPTLEHVATQLKRQNIKFYAAISESPTEALAPEMRVRLKGVKPEEIVMFEGKSYISLVQVKQIYAQPIDQETAFGLIRKQLISKKSKELLDGEAAKLKQAAKIEYFGAFVNQGKGSVERAAPQIQIENTLEHYAE